MTYNDNYNIDLAKSSEKKLMIVFAKELFFVEKASRKKNYYRYLSFEIASITCYHAMISGKIKNKIFSSNLNELCDKKTLQDKQVGNNSDMINGELFAIADDLFEKKLRIE